MIQTQKKKKEKKNYPTYRKIKVKCMLIYISQKFSPAHITYYAIIPGPIINVYINPKTLPAKPGYHFRSV